MSSNLSFINLKVISSSIIYSISSNIYSDVPEPNFDYNEKFGGQKPEVITVVALTDPEYFNDYFLYEVKPDRAFYAQMNQAYADIDKEYSEVTGDVLDAKTKAAMDVAKGKERANSAKSLGTIYADGDP